MSIHTNWLGEFFKHSLLLAGAVVVLLPFYLMLSYSLKSPSEIETNTGGFFGAQQIMTDNRCVKAGNPEEDCLMRPNRLQLYGRVQRSAAGALYAQWCLRHREHFFNSGDHCPTLCLCAV